MMTSASMIRRSIPGLIAGVLILGALAWPSLPLQVDEPGPYQEPPGTPSRVEVQEGRLVIDGAPAPILRCVGYQPIPVGVSPAYGYRWADFAENYEGDLPLLADLGANTLAVNTRAASDAGHLRAFMSKAHERGMWVILVVDGPNQQDVRDEAVQEAFLADVTGAVEAYRDHPALLGWQLGIEVDYSYRDTDRVSAWYALFERATREAHAGDPHHPVFTASSVITEPDAFLQGSPSADLYGVNYYGLTRGSMSGYLSSLAERVAGYPVLVTEFGVDALDNRTGVPYEETQADVLRETWSGIQDAHDSGAPVIGGCVHEWSDQWWKGGELDAHDPTPAWPSTDKGILPDEAFSEEWFGLVAIRAGSQERDLRESYHRLRELWDEG